MIIAPSLLITDDDRDFRETLQGVFEPQGFRTLLAADGHEALRIVNSQEEVHLVLMDMHMPRLSGLEAIAQIKRRRARLPCILISGRLDDEIRARADAFRILSKPVSYQEVTSAVHLAMRLTYGWPQEGEANRDLP